MKSGNLNFLEPSGPLQACNGTALPLPLYSGEFLVKFSPCMEAEGLLLGSQDPTTETGSDQYIISQLICLRFNVTLSSKFCLGTFHMFFVA